MKGSDLDDKRSEDLKARMERLWTDIFNDSEGYVSLVFDTYFNPDNVFVEYDGEDLISALLGVPYDFIIPEEGNDIILKGMYLCGLATKPKYRNRGLMGNLMEEAESDFTERGFDLAFLIPADNHLRCYYAEKGYDNASYRMPVIVSENDVSEMLVVSSISDLIKDHDHVKMDILSKWCCTQERKTLSASILHSARDFLTIFRENENTVFITKRTSDLKYPILTNLIAVAFPEIEEGERRGVTVKDIIFNHDETDEKEILQNLRVYFGVSKITLLKNVSNVREIGHNTSPYAMIKSLGKNQEKSRYHNQLFRVSLMLD